MKEVLACINRMMEAQSIPYQYERWKGKRTFPYFVGSYQENETRFEDGYTSGTATIDGWNNKSMEDLLDISDKIKSNYTDHQETKDGVLFRVRYSGSIPDPVETEGLHHIIITLEVEEWKGD